MPSAGRWPLTPEPDGTFFIDRDPKGFPLILRCLRGEKIEECCVSAEKLAAFRHDITYYGLPTDVVERSLLPHYRTDTFTSESDHNDDAVITDGGMVVTRSSDPDQTDKWALCNSYGGQDHVVVAVSVVKCVHAVILGVCDMEPRLPDACFVGIGIGRRVVGTGLSVNTTSCKLCV